MSAPMALDLTREIAFFLLVTACAYTDIARGHVYNHLTLPAIALGLLLAAASTLTTGSWTPLFSSLLGLGIGFGALVLFYYAGQLGGGDVKLMAAVGALEGYPRIVAMLFLAALIGSLLGIGAALWKGQLWTALRGAGRTLFFRRDAPRITEGGDVAALAGGAGGATPQLAGAEGGGLGGAAGPTIPFGFAIAVGGIGAWILHNIDHLA